MSAWVGLGLNLGYSVGVIAAGMLASNVQVAYTAFGVAVAVVVVAFVILAPDDSTKNVAMEAIDWKAFGASFWINPLRHSSFAWAFTARFLYILGVFLVSNFQFFILIDYIGLDLAEANVQIGIIGIVALIPTVIAPYVAGWISDRFGRRKLLLVIACVLLGVSYVVRLLAPDLTGMYILSILGGIGFGIYLTSDAVIMTQVLPNLEGAAGKDLGILNIATVLPQSLSAAMPGIIISSLGGYQGLLIAGVIVAIFAGVSIAFIKIQR